MERNSAYEQFLVLLPEKTMQSIVDSLASAEYDRKEIERLVKLGETLREASFSFGDKQLDKLSEDLAVSIDELNDFLSVHYAPHDPQAIVFQLYPNSKYAEKIKTADGATSTWIALKQEGLSLGRRVKEDYLSLISRYQMKGLPKGGFKFPHKVPAGTRWEDLILLFEDDGTIRVNLKQYDVTLSFEDMGLVDGRTGKPSSQWAFLLVLAKHGGELKPTDADAQNRFKKQKQLLSEKMQSYFSIDFDPFYPYERSYKAKFTLGLAKK